MATRNTMYEFNPYMKNIFYVRDLMTTTPYEKYPYLTDTTPKAGPFCSSGICPDSYNTYNNDTAPLYIPSVVPMYSMGDERYGIPEQEQPLDMSTDLLPSHPWLKQTATLSPNKLLFQMSSVSNIARSYNLTIGDRFEFVFVTRDTGYLVLPHKTVPVHYKWERSVSTTIAFLTIQFQGYMFNDLTLELRASTPSYGTAYSPLGFSNYLLHYERYTDKSLLPHSNYSISLLPQ